MPALYAYNMLSVTYYAGIKKALLHNYVLVSFNFTVSLTITLQVFQDFLR